MAMNYTTSIKAEKTIMEIQKCLVENGATKITIDYTDKLPTSITFCLKLNGEIAGFSLPANHLGVYISMENDTKIPKRLLTEEQSLNVSWRIIKSWIESQVAMVEAGLVEMTEIFLPYLIIGNGNTLYTEIKSNGKLFLTM